MKLCEHFAKGGDYWIKGMLTCRLTTGRCFCLEGALREFYPESNLRIAAREQLRKVIKRLFPDRYFIDPDASNAVVNFNDHFDTRFEDVIRVVQEAGV
jgi:hypothetical protein